MLSKLARRAGIVALGTAGGQGAVLLVRLTCGFGPGVNAPFSPPPWRYPATATPCVTVEAPHAPDRIPVVAWIGR